MQCESWGGAIDALADGTLGPAEQAALEGHLEMCAACRALAADLRAIRAAAAALERVDLPGGAWARLAARLRLEPAPGRRRAWAAPQPGRPAWLTAAAVLTIAVGLAVAWLLRPSTGLDAADQPDAERLLASVQAELAQAEVHYQKAIDGLEALVGSGRGDLDPQVAAVLQQSMQVIDQAISESRAALRVQPASQPAQESLFEGLRAKVALLQQTVELINEMRKGNQAETARIVEGRGRL